MKVLRQEQSLRDHGDTGEVVYMLDPKFQDLIPQPLGQLMRGPGHSRSVTDKDHGVDGISIRYQMFRYGRARTKCTEGAEMISR